MFLVDTNVISALALSKRDVEANLIDWLDRASPHLYLSVITVAEVTAGITKAGREGAAATAKVHGLAVLTRNMRHFEPLGVRVLDPFIALPALVNPAEPGRKETL